MEENNLKQAINGAYEFCEKQQTALDKGEISEEEWFEIHNKFFTEIYLKSDNPRLQSGHRGDEARYRYTQGMILEAFWKDGSFIDIGCANGYLIEKLQQWIRNSGITINFYGLDISRGLIEAAKKRLPGLKENLFFGNGLYWKPPMKFDYVCVRELDYVPKGKRRDFFFHLYDFLSSNGRLILGPFTENGMDKGLINEIEEWGIKPSGFCFKSHQDHKQLCRKLYWFDKN